MCDFYQEQRAVFTDQGGHGDGQNDLIHAFIDVLCFGTQLHIDLRGFAFEEDLRGAGDFERQILDVQFFDREDGLCVFRHGV